MPVPAVARIALWGAVLFALFVWFVKLERRSERHTIFNVLLVTYLFEAVLGGHATHTSFGLLRPHILGQDFRIEDVVIVALLAARFFGRRGRGYIPSGMPAVAAFGLWYVTAAVIGVMNHLDPAQVLYQGKALFYVVGGIVAASGADPERLAAQLPRPAKLLAAVVVIATVLGFLHLKFAFSLPLQSFTEFGVLSNDTATALVIVGALVLLVEAVRTPHRVGVLLAGVVLLMAPLAGDHRASYLVVGWVVIAMLATTAGGTWRRRSDAGPGRIALFVGLFALAGGVIFAFTSAPAIVFNRFETAFGGDATSQSAASRLDLARRALELTAQRPLVGWGVGMQVIRTSEYRREDSLAAAHNVVADVLLRSGVIGLGLFVIALAAVVRIGLRRWRRESSHPLAAVCLAATMGVVGVVVKSMVEPSFDKFRLSLLFGLCVGLVLVAGRIPAIPSLPRPPGRARAAERPAATETPDALVGGG